MKSIQAILVPLDGSPSSLVALDQACVLAGDYGARVEILNVIPDKDPLSAQARADVDREMDAALGRARVAIGAKVSRRVTSGDPLRAIIERAREGFDLVVMGTHGATGRLAMMKGSLTESVVGNAPCPVLTVRAASDGYESFSEKRHHRPSVANQR